MGGAAPPVGLLLVEGWLRRASGPPLAEIEAGGDVKGRKLVHLQCHFVLDTLRWARVGATVTGVDFSPAAIHEASALAERAGLSSRARFVRADVFDAPACSTALSSMSSTSVWAHCVGYPTLRPGRARRANCSRRAAPFICTTCIPSRSVSTPPPSDLPTVVSKSRKVPSSATRAGE